MNNKPLTFEEYKDIYSKVPRAVIDLVIQAPEGIVLTLRKLPDWRGYWHFPGSTILMGQNIEETIHRIAEKELNAKIKIERMLGYLEYPSEKKVRDFGQTVSFVFLCTLVGGKLKPDADAAAVKIWKKLPKKMIGEQKEFVRKYLS